MEIDTSCYMPFHASEAVKAIGFMNIAAASGNRVLGDLEGEPEHAKGYVRALHFPVNNKWTVTVRLHVDDEYEVFRTENGVVKGYERAFFDEVGDAVYRAACYLNVVFGRHQP